MVFVDASVPQLTFVFIAVVAALAASFVILFCTLERSVRVMQVRNALVRRIDRRFGGDFDNRQQ